MGTPADLLRGALDTVLLDVIEGGKTYGYEIAEAIRQQSAGHLIAQEGTLYPALHRLEKQGLLRARWEDSPQGRPRKHYGLTPSGRKRLAELRHEWKDFSRSVNKILGLTHVRPAGI